MFRSNRTAGYQPDIKAFVTLHRISWNVTPCFLIWPVFYFNNLLNLNNPGPRIHRISTHGFPKFHGYQHGYPWFLDVSLQLSIKVRISTLISKEGYPCKDMLQRISVNNKYPWMDIHVFMDINLQLSMLLWISIWISLDFYGYPCIDLLWILDPGNMFSKTWRCW